MNKNLEDLENQIPKLPQNHLHKKSKFHPNNRKLSDDQTIYQRTDDKNSLFVHYDPNQSINNQTTPNLSPLNKPIHKNVSVDIPSENYDSSIQSKHNSRYHNSRHKELLKQFFNEHDTYKKKINKKIDNLNLRFKLLLIFSLTSTILTSAFSLYLYHEIEDIK